MIGDYSMIPMCRVKHSKQVSTHIFFFIQKVKKFRGQVVSWWKESIDR
jgi:hypothetical protein